MAVSLWLVSLGNKGEIEQRLEPSRLGNIGFQSFGELSLRAKNQTSESRFNFAQSARNPVCFELGTPKEQTPEVS